jgi:hypothetical protein
LILEDKNPWVLWYGVIASKMAPRGSHLVGTHSLEKCSPTLNYGGSMYPIKQGRNVVSDFWREVMKDFVISTLVSLLHLLLGKPATMSWRHTDLRGTTPPANSQDQLSSHASVLSWKQSFLLSQVSRWL